MTNPDEMLVRARAGMTNIELNAMAQAVNQQVQTIPDPALQLGVLMVCAALAFGRVIVANKIIGGPAKKMILDRAMKDFANKVHKFGWGATPQPEKS